MKRLYIWILLVAIQASLFIPTVLKSQPREQQNVYRVRVKSRYIIEDGKRTTKFLAVEQQITDSMGRMHTEIFLDWETRYPNNYRWHYFDGQTKYKTDFFENEKLTRIEEYEYDYDKLKRLTLKAVNQNDTSFIVRVDYDYNPNGTIQKATGYNENGKRGFRAKYTFDFYGTEILRKVRGKRNHPPDSIVFLQRSPTYDSLGRVTREVLVEEKIGEGRSTQNKRYTYDESGNILEMVLLDESGNQLLRNEYQYRKDNRIKMQNVYNANDELIDCLAWRYEIYKTNDRRQRVLE